MQNIANAAAGDRSGDILQISHPSLSAIFAPKNVAVVGATEKVGSVGRTILWNLISSPFGGTVFPINPKRSSILGIRAYPGLKDVPEQIDLAVIVTPAPTIPAMRERNAAAIIPMPAASPSIPSTNPKRRIARSSRCRAARRTPAR